MSEPYSTEPLLSAAHYQSYPDYRTIATNESHTTRDDEHRTEKWNEPRINFWRVLATFYSFIVVGANDGAYGAMVHYLGKYYDADYTTVSVVFLSPFIGYAIAAVGNSWIHEKFGQRGIALIGTGMHIIAYLATTQHPVYPVLILIFILAGLGNGIVDASWNAWIGAMHNSSQLMGILHAFYGLGAALAPLVATFLVTDRAWAWYEFYYVMAGAAGLEFVTSVAAFWSATGSAFRAKSADTGVYDHLSSESSGSSPRASTSTSARSKNPTRESLKLASTWIISLFLFVYVGVEVTIGGWVFTFLVDLRNTPVSVAGVVTFTYWGGLTVGRVCLGFLTPFFRRQRLAVLVYLGACLVLHLAFCVLDDLRLSVITVTLLGFFLGPLYPEAVIAQAKLLPRYLHVAAVGFACALGSAGGSVFPFITGAAAKAFGIQVLQPAVLVMLLLCLVLWLVLPAQHEDGEQPTLPVSEESTLSRGSGGSSPSS